MTDVKDGYPKGAAAAASGWQRVEGTPDTERLVVTGGWIYRIRDGAGAFGVFVPNVMKEVTDLHRNFDDATRPL